MQCVKQEKSLVIRKQEDTADNRCDLANQLGKRTGAYGRPRARAGRRPGGAGPKLHPTTRASKLGAPLTHSLTHSLTHHLEAQ